MMMMMITNILRALSKLLSGWSGAYHVLVYNISVFRGTIRQIMQKPVAYAVEYR